MNLNDTTPDNPLGLSPLEQHILREQCAATAKVHADEDRRRKSEAQANRFEVWMEGYQTSGEVGTAQLLGSFFAHDFNNAVIKMIETRARENPTETGHYYTLQPGGVWTCWGCRLFDNETEARARYG